MLQSRPRYLLAVCLTIVVAGLGCHQLDFSPRVPEGARANTRSFD